MNSRQKNVSRKSRSEAEHYWPTRVRVDGRAHWVLLTDSEVDRAYERAQKNPEDMPGLWKRIRINFGI